MDEHEVEVHGRMSSILRFLFKGIVPILILSGALWGAKRLKDTAPTVSKRPSVRRATLVATEKAKAANRPLVLEAMGTVMAARQVELRPQVGGRVVWVAAHLIPGGQFQEGEPLMRLEKSDFELAVSQRKSEVQMAEAALEEARQRLTLAESNLKLEMGNQAVAQRELELLKEEIEDENQDLILRRPQLEAAKADVEAAEAAVASAEASLESARSRLEEARLDLERTEILAPFNVVVEERLVDQGDTVSMGSPLVRLVGSDEFWVKVSLPQGELKWVSFPAEGGEVGSEVRIFNESAWGNEVHRIGHVVRLLPSVDSDGRMAHVLVSIEDPLGFKGEKGSIPSLLMESYVRAEIVGPSFPSLMVVRREKVHEGDRVWIMNDKDLLEMRKVKVRYRGRDEIIIESGLEEGERIVVTDLSAPVEGMSLREDEPSETPKT